MAEYELDPRPYFLILHSLLRHDELDYNREAIGACVAWVQSNATTLRKVCSTAEFAVIMTYYAFWDKHKEAPNREGMKPLILAKQQPEAQLAILEQYDTHEDDLTVLNPIELLAQLDMRIDDYEKHKLSQVLAQAGHILVGSHSVDDKVRKTKIVYEGPRGALKYIHEREDEGLLLNEVRAPGGVLAETIGKIGDRYQRIEGEAKRDDLFITSGINLIDNHLGGLRRGELNGALGFAGQRKSALVRTAAYHAARNGFRVLHIPLESTYAEEETFYAAMHSGLWSEGTGINKTRFERGMLSEPEKKHLAEVGSQLADGIAKNIVVRIPKVPSWPEVRAIITQENDKEPIDLVVIDYLTLLSTPGARDDIADKTAIAQDCKRLATSLNKGRGVCILTPIQGNRKGYTEAGENDGAWSTTGIFQYSELDKSFDNVFYIYFDDGLNREKKVRIGSCKTRREANIPSTLVEIDHGSGRIGGLPARKVEFSDGTPVEIARSLQSMNESLALSAKYPGALSPSLAAQWDRLRSFRNE